MKYSIDSGACGASGGTAISYWVTRQVVADDCAKPCADFLGYLYAYDTGAINISGLADGSHTINICRERACPSCASGWATPDTCTFTKCTATLTVTLSASPSTGGAPLTTNLTASVGGTATGNITYDWDWTNDGTYESSGSSNTVSHTYSTAANYTAKVRVTRGCAGATDTTSITVTSNPTCALTAKPASMEAGSSVTISWSSTNATRCGAWGDWGGWKNLSGSESKQMNTAGHYTFHLTCDTGDGTPNGSCKDSIDVVCSAAQKPTISLSLPTASWLNYNPNFKATVTDPNGDSVRGIFTVTPGVTGAVGNLVASGGTTCYPADCSSGLVLNDGEYFWEAYASDSSDSGCQSDPSSRWLGIDKTAPTGDITHSPASPDTGDTVTFTATGSDALSGLKTIQVYVDGSLKNTCSGSTICAYTGGPYSLGAHTYYAVFTDNANNSLTTSTKNFNVSAIDVTCSFSASPSYNCIPPNFVSTLTAAVTGGTATGNITYQIDCTNNGSIDRTFGPTANLSYAYAGCPAYGANATARVVVTREGVSCTALANLYVSSFDVTPPVANILTAPPYNTQQFSATYDQDGATGPSSSQNVSGSCTWSSSAPAVATINATGLATAVAAGGPATITSTYAPSGDSCTDASAISVGLPVSNFKVLLSGINRAPTASNFNTTESNCCDPNPFALFVWTYGDPDGDFETRYDFQIDNESGFNSPWVVDRTFNVSPVLAPGSQNNQSVNISSAVSPPAGWLGYNIQYWWRVRVWDSQGLSSGWVPLPPLMFKTTKTHRCPVCDFTWSPTSPIPDEDVQFTNTSACYNDSQSVVPCSSFSWSINPATANPSTSVLQNPLVIFSGSGGYTVSLTVTDGSGYTCTTIKSVRISLHLPKWKEI